MDYEKRLSRLAASIGKLEAPALLVTSVTNVTYLTGFTGDSSYLLVLPDQQILISDPRYEEQIQDECEGLEVYIRPPSETIIEAACRCIEKAKLNAILLESSHVTLAAFEIFKAKLPKVNWISSTGLVETLREVKEREEIVLIQRAIDMAERASLSVRAGLRKTQSEREVAHDLENSIRKLGGVGCSFAPIVGVGARGALPHGTPSDLTMEADSFVLIDWGAREGLYISDLTRVLVTSRIPAKFERIYHVVLEANQAATRAIRPGVAASEIDRIARSVIEQAGFGKRFGHALGHGIGLQVHESPRMGAEQNRPLRAGMVVSVEPGIYIPGWGGIRIEDDVLVTKDGHQVLSSLPRGLSDNMISLL